MIYLILGKLDFRLPLERAFFSFFLRIFYACAAEHHGILTFT